MRFNRELAQRVFESAIKAQQAQSLDGLDVAVAPAVRRLGFQQFASIEVLGGESRRIEVLSGEVNPAWLRRYEERGYAGGDAAIAEVIAAVEPFFRTELARRGGPSPLDAQIMDEARAFGIRDTLFIPQHHANGAASAVVLIATEEVEDTLGLRTAAYLLGVHYGHLVRRILGWRPLGRGQPCGISLSRRQLECLNWVRGGKSSPEIGDILNLSGRTVDAYLAAACERLGVRTRVQAVARALAEGLLPADTVDLQYGRRH